MSNNTVDAGSITKKDFSCEITRIACEYEGAKKGDKKEAVLYKKNRAEDATCTVQYNNGTPTLVGGISNIDTNNFFFITNHKGKDILLNVQKLDNECTDERHKQYEIISDNQDPNQKEKVKNKKKIEEKSCKLYYYNLFYRQWEYAKEGAREGLNKEELGTAVVNSAVGRTIGSAADYFMAFRFFLLPPLKESDKDFFSTQLIYKTCPHRNNVPAINIISYPDISFEFVVDFCGASNKYKASDEFNSKNIASNLNTPLQLDETERGKWNIGLTVNYASTEKKLEIGHKIEGKYDDEGTIKGQKKYEEYGTIYETLKGFFDLVEELIQLIANNEVNKDDKSILSDNKKWLTGSLSFEPSLRIKWKYSVSDDLKTLGRFFLIDLTVKVVGKIVFDLIKIVQKFAVAATIGATGGAAAPFKGILDWLLTKVIPWLIEKFVDVEANLTFKAIVEGGGKLTIDTVKEKKFDIGFKPISVTFSADLDVGLTIKATFFIKTEFGLAGKAGAKIKFDFLLDYNQVDAFGGTSHVNLKIKTKAEVGKLSISYVSKDSFEVLDYSTEASSETEIWSWDGWEKEFDPAIWTLFTFDSK